MHVPWSATLSCMRTAIVLCKRSSSASEVMLCVASSMGGWVHAHMWRTSRVPCIVTAMLVKAIAGTLVELHELETARERERESKMCGEMH